ncbi:MAG TPA: aromatic-ring-hydroxylating dioxygenase subunit beta [Alphaproteobacteria bacterium]|jgi:benzoate/toluate 1,2-dioxygenase beta subunit
MSPPDADAMSGASVSAETRDAIDTLLQREAALLDERRYEDWLALYAADAWYWVPHRPGQTSPRDEVSLFYDDRMLMETRVRRLMTAIAHAETPRTRTSRVVSRAAVAPSAEAGCDFVAAAKFVMIEYRLNGQHLYGGTSHFGIRRAGDGFAIAWKRVDLVNAEGTHEPMSVPF